MPRLIASALSLRDLEYAVAVGRERHFGRAALACGVSQAALSEQIRKLEDVLGLPLFERTKRRVEPTRRGHELLAQAELLLGDARRLLENARRSAEPLSGELRLGVIPTLGPYYLPAVIALGRREFPRIDLRVREATTTTLLAELRNGDLDAALLALPVPLEGFTADPLFFEPFRCACPNDHPLGKKSAIAIADLEHTTLLLMEDGHCLRDQTILLCERAQPAKAPRYASSLEMMRQMIAAGEGVAIMPRLAAGEHTAMHGLIVYREFNKRQIGRTIALVRRATETRIDDLIAIASFMRAALPDGVEPVTTGESH